MAWESAEKKFKDMGIDRVYPPGTSPTRAIQDLEADISSRGGSNDIRTRKLSEDEFFKERREVLAQWPTGRDVDLEESDCVSQSLPPQKVWLNKMSGSYHTHTGS